MKYLPLLAILFFSCVTDPEPTSLLGTWRSTYQTEAGTIVTRFTVSITSSDKSSFSGNGTWASNTNCTIQGTRKDPDVSFTITIPQNTFFANGSFVNENSIRYRLIDETTDYFMNRQ